MFSLPSDFWQEFDRRLDAKLDEKLDEKLDKKFDEKLKPIYNWIQRQDLMIEKEITRALQKHLEEHFTGFYTVAPTVFPKTLRGKDGSVITEFDGLFILTNNLQVSRWFAPIKGRERPPMASVFTPEVIAYLVIVEAKQNVTVSKWNHKVKQMEIIEQLIADSKKHPESIPKALSSLGLQYFMPTVGLYIGGQDIDATLKSVVIETIDKKKTLGATPIIGYLELNGARFSVFDEKNDYGSTFRGGQKKKASS